MMVNIKSGKSFLISGVLAPKWTVESHIFTNVLMTDNFNLFAGFLAAFWLFDASVLDLGKFMVYVFSWRSKIDWKTILAT
tara:strand:+ start:276 stop:515 length:240 start_codon:yes stop_codon:yes gene_type:complete